MLEVRPVESARERRRFLTYPWRLYRNDPLWVPPLVRERSRTVDPAKGAFFANGTADFFLAYSDGKPVGTICCAEDRANTAYKGQPECMIGFFDCVEDYGVADALLSTAERWARDRGMSSVYGTYDLDREADRVGDRDAETSGDLVERLVPRDLLPAGILRPLRPGAFDRVQQPLGMVDDLGRRLALHAQRLAGGVRRVRLQRQ